MHLFWNPETDRLVMAAFDLPPAEAGRTYQLWGIQTGLDPVSLGVFQTDAQGRALLVQTVPDGLDFEISAVTDEPAGGSPQPTTTPFLAGSWSAAE
jgi:anti-sigma-K factor RskA